MGSERGRHTEQLNERVAGRYELLERIGEGGFGTVYLARQTEPIDRRVALKLIKLGMDTAQVLERFELERQALAVMDHPNVAKILDGGVTAAGRSFFVMELVDGPPITEFCDHHKLDVRARLVLFERVCLAIEHAHQKGILHRDIKPSNVLVATIDGEPTPKIIDFGIAKALDATGAAVTQAEQQVGTPEYMSPEQAAGGAAVDTRTDVYGLGALLYELLTGERPFASEPTGSSPAARIAQIGETTPQPPSHRLRNGDASTRDVAAHRRTSPSRLAGHLAGELDWIVLRALEKEADRRYDSARDLALDVRRFLDGAPVSARPTSRAYLTRKFVVRHRLAVTAAALALSALLVGLAIALRGIDAERRDEVSARQAQTAAETAGHQADADRERAAAGEARARREASRANAVLGLFQRLFEADDTRASRGGDYLVSTLLDELAGQLGPALEDEPETAVRLGRMLANALVTADRIGTALPLLKDVVRVLGELGLESTEDGLRARFDLARFELEGHPAKLLGVIEQIMAELEPDSRVRVPCLRYVSSLNLRLGNKKLGLEAALDALALREGPQQLVWLANAYYQNSKLDDAVRVSKRAVEMQPEHANNHQRGFTRLNLGHMLVLAGRWSEAIGPLDEALGCIEKAHGKRSFQYRKAYHMRAWAYKGSGDLAKAERGFTRVLRAKRAAGLDGVQSQIMLAMTLQERGKPSRAVQQYEDAIARIRKRGGVDGHPYPVALHGLAFAKVALGEFELARDTLRETLRVMRQSRHLEVALATGSLGSVLREHWGEPGEAMQLHRESLTLREKRDPGAGLADAMLEMARDAFDLGDHDTALDWVDRYTATIEQLELGPKLSGHRLKALISIAMEDLEAAEQEARAAVAIGEKKGTKEHANALGALTAVLDAKEQADEAQIFRQQAIELWQTYFPDLDREFGYRDAQLLAPYAVALAERGEALSNAGEFAAAGAVLDRALALIRRARPEEHWRRHDISSLRAAARLHANRGDVQIERQAEHELRAAYEDMRPPIPYQSRRQLAGARLARWYRATGRADAVRKIEEGQ